MLEITNLSKRYGLVQAVDGVSFRVAPGEAVGLLGPNGAGKTTTVSIICGLVHADEGTVHIDGHSLSRDTDPAKRSLGLVPQELALYEELTARQNLELFGRLYDLDRRELGTAMASALELVGLADRANDRVKTFSGGMKRRLNLAAALLHDPDWLVLDEPTVGVDPQSRNAIFENLEHLRSRGKSLIYTTHYMEEAERLCDRIVIIDRGRVVADDHLLGLYHRLPASNVIQVDLATPAADPGAIDGLRRLEGVSAVDLAGHTVKVAVDDLSVRAPRVLEWLNGNGHPFTHFISERPSLETVFLTLTGRSLRDA